MKKKSNEAHSYFLETFCLLRTSPRKFTYRIENHNFSRNESLLLQALLAYSRGHREDFFELIRTRKFNEEFLEGIRLYLLGLGYNHYSYYKFAVEKLEESITILNEFESDFLLRPYIITLIAYSNMRSREKVSYYLNELVIIKKIDDDYLKILKDHALSVGYLSLGEYDKALSILKKVYREKSIHLKLMQASFFLVEFTIYLRQSKIEDCYKILTKYKKIPSFTIKPNYLFMKSLLDHLYKGKALYIYENDFVDFPELKDQLLCVKGLASSDIKMASLSWESLQKHNKELYKENFEFNSDICLFSIALEKYNYLHKNEIDLDQIKNSDLNPTQKLEAIFKTDNFSISKERLVDIIWQEETTELNLARLRVLVSRFNRASDTKLKSYQDTYKKVS